MTYRAIDASVVIAKMLDEERPRWVDEAVTAARHDELDLIAPTLLWVEVGNRLVRRDMTDEQALDAMLRVEAIGIETVELQRPIRLRAVQLGREHQLSMYRRHVSRRRRIDSRSAAHARCRAGTCSRDHGSGATGPRSRL